MSKKKLDMPTVESVRTDKMHDVLKKIAEHVKKGDRKFSIEVEEEALDAIVQIVDDIGYTLKYNEYGKLTFLINNKRVIKTYDDIVASIVGTHADTIKDIISADEVFNRYLKYIIAKINKEIDEMESKGYPTDCLYKGFTYASVAERLKETLAKYGYEVEYNTPSDYRKKVSIRVTLSV